MLNFQTIEFIGLLNELAEKTKVGFFPFSKAKYEQKDGILYDDTDKDNGERYPVVADCLIDELHHDIISLYSNVYENCGATIDVVIDEDGNAYIDINFEDTDMSIVVENGRWYCC